MDLRHAEEHLIELAALAGERSDYINDNLPQIIAALEIVRQAADKFYEGL